jgi:hypothetical protein
VPEVGEGTPDVPEAVGAAPGAVDEDERCHRCSLLRLGDA